MFDKAATITLKETAKYLYIDSGLLKDFFLTPLEVNRLQLAQYWIGKLLDEQAERDRGANAA